jgi:excinuclease ABC subunit C
MTRADRPDLPNGSDRFNEDRATYTVKGSQPDLEAGVAAIREVQATLKPRPGVYRMLDARGDVLYVGKARALKNRVANYTQVDRLPLRLKRMVSQTRSMTIVTTNSEAEALLLEAQLIKRYRPPYNVLLRDDKSFPFILLRADHAFPRIRSIAARARPRATTTARSPAPVRSTPRSTRCRSCSCCAAAPTVSSRGATGPACFTRSSAAPRPASGGSARRLCRTGGRGEGLPRRQIDPPCRQRSAAQMEAGGRGARFRARRDAARPAARATFIQGSQAINAEGRGQCRYLRVAAKGGQVGDPGLLHPRRPELGPPRLLPDATPKGLTKPRC